MKEIFVHQPNIAFLKVSGPDAKKLLQGQLTCDLEKITINKGSYGAHCNAKGRIISFFYLFQFEDAYFLQLPAEMVSTAHAALQKYAPFFKVTISEINNLKVIGYSGSYFENLFRKEINAAIQNSAIILKKGNRYEIIGNNEAISPILENLKKNNPQIQQEQESMWKCQNIQEFIPNIYKTTSEMFLPHEINLIPLEAVSFTKGCYTGQEIVARLEYRGKLKTQFYCLLVNANLAPGQEIFNTSGRANIVDSCQIGYNQSWVLVISQDLDLYLDEAKSQKLSILEKIN